MSTEPLAPRRPRPVVLVAAALLLWLGAAFPASAAPSPGEEIADALRTSPVYVGPGLEHAVTPEERRDLVARIEKTGIDIRVVLVPLVKGDPWNGDAEQLAHVVRDRLGGGDMVVLTSGDDFGSDDVQGFDWPRDRHQAREAASAVYHEEEMKEAGLAARIERAIEIIDAGNGRQAYEDATADLRTDAPGAGTGAGDSRAAGDDDGTGTTVGVLAVAAALLLLATTVLVRRRGRGGGRRTGPASPFAAPKAVFAAARAADEETLRRRAHEEVVALGEETGDREGAGPAVGRALDAYAAAGTVLDGARGLPDLAGVLALVAEGRDALHEADGGGGGKGARQAPLPLCFFHPLHGRADRTIRWRPMGRRDGLRVAACAACASAVREHRAPEVLTDRVDGRDVPYFEVASEESLWAATGYGSLGDASLAARVARGDFRRTARGR